MGLLNKKETAVQNITLMSIMSAINVVISVLSTLMLSVAPIISVLLIIILPLTSTIIALFCKTKYYPIYTFASIGLAMVATLWNMEHTLFYLVPSIITGFIFGLLIKHKIHHAFSIGIVTLIQTGIIYSMIPLLNLLYGTNFIDVIKAIFKSNAINYAMPTLVMLVSLVQTTLSLIVVTNEVRKLGEYNVENLPNMWVLPVISLFFILIGGALLFVSISWSYAMIFMSLIFSIEATCILIKTKVKITLIGFGISILISIILFSVFYTRINETYALSLLALYPLLNNISSIVVSFLIKK